MGWRVFPKASIDAATHGRHIINSCVTAKLPFAPLELQQAATAISACTGLTSLSLEGFALYRPQQDAFQQVGWCAAVAQLPSLQALSVAGMSLQCSDLMHLSSAQALSVLRLRPLWTIGHPPLCAGGNNMMRTRLTSDSTGGNIVQTCSPSLSSPLGSDT